MPDGQSLTARRVTDLPSHVSRITEVDLLERPIGDTDRRKLSGLAQDVTVLNLAGTPVTDAGMIHVGRLLGLRKLYLGGCAISDNGLRELRRLTQLRFLGLFVTRVTDAGMPSLGNMKQLESINLGKTRTTDSAVRRVLPKVSIERPN